MNTIRTLFFRGFLSLAFIGSLACLTFGKEGPSVISIPRNVAWNDLVIQVQSLPQEFPQDSLEKDLRTIQKFLQAHEREVSVGIYNIEVFRAIDRARARFQKADKDLEVIRNELSYKEEQAKRGR